MNFFKENSYDIVKLYLTQIAISVFALIMYTSAGFIQANTSLSATFQIIISIFSILFYFVLLYTTERLPCASLGASAKNLSTTY